ncbi:hypothetical protein Clacol_000454 [Clathrus columnatus]|uniref:FAD-binding PCMH-type domain-containing protein n=1 Tax=Clathrus columnatus TaxID=1419009 RepID=A0AAV4ZZC0_9AGAM|nr:hypothetical protein Clacol_000454 [Clathrus columnatus]
MSTESFKKIEDICQRSKGISQYFRYGSLGYKYSVAHWLKSSCEVSLSAVEPGRLEDLQEIVKGGGHATNPRFSSVEDGLQISMIRFNELTLNSDNTVTMGSGCLWDEVYRYLNTKQRTVVGGAGAGGVGVAGWLLGGGYSLRTNQYGLGVDNIIEIGVVTPTGDFIKARQDNDKTKDLFWALRGGGNKLGIVTYFVLRTFPENGVYGGTLSYSAEKTESAMTAISNFTAKWKNHKTRDLKGAVVGAFRHARVQGELRYEFTVQCFYSAPNVPEPNPFQEFLNIGPDRGSLNSTTYVALDTEFSLLHIAIPPTIDHIFSILAAKYPAMDGIAELDYRGRWGCVMITDFTRLSDLMKEHSGLRVILDIWPFVDDIFQHKEAGPSAWPPANSQAVFPMIIICYWEDPKDDKVWLDNMSATISGLNDFAKKNGASYEGAPVYSNTTLGTTTPKEIYQSNLKQLVEIIRNTDPHGVMRRAGGFNITIASNASRLARELERLGIGAKEAEKLKQIFELLSSIVNA